METVILRPPAVYGPRDRDIFEFFRWAARGIKPLLGSSRPHLSIVHVRDLASAIVRSALGPHPGGTTYFVADPATYTYDDIFTFLGRAAGRDLRTVRIPTGVLRGAAWISEMASRVLPSPLPLNREKLEDLLQPYWTCSPSAFEHDTGFRARISGAEGFAQTFDWYRSVGWIS
jgi:nucleoside-diphosphate-sugar epimerase